MMTGRSLFVTSVALTAALIAAICPPRAHGEHVTMVFGTGQDGVVGEPDVSVDLLSGPGGGFPEHPYVVRPFPTPVVWNDPFPGTNWISPTLAPNGQDSASSPVGLYVYNMYFDLPMAFREPELQAFYYTDNDMGSVLLNGGEIEFTHSPQVTMGSASTADPDLFVAGRNVLSLGVENWHSLTGLDLLAVVSFEPLIPGDANCDGLVDDLDLTALATHWQLAGGRAEGDFTGDGFVGDYDLTVLATAWPSGDLDVSAVPEPATVWLVALVAGRALVYSKRDRRNFRRTVRK